MSTYTYDINERCVITRLTEDMQMKLRRKRNNTLRTKMSS